MLAPMTTPFNNDKKKKLQELQIQGIRTNYLKEKHTEMSKAFHLNWSIVKAHVEQQKKPNLFRKNLDWC